MQVSKFTPEDIGAIEYLYFKILSCIIFLRRTAAFLNEFRILSRFTKIQADHTKSVFV